MLKEPFTPSFFKSLEQLKIRSRRTFLGLRQGSHSSRRRGHGLEFSDYRLYSSGDDFRHIDWRVLGKTDRLYVRQFSEEQALNVVILLDTSRSMTFPEGEHKYELARDLALAVGYIALADGDSVTLALLGKKLTPKYVGPRAFAKAIADVTKVKPEGSFNLLQEARKALATQKIPGRLFFVSDFLAEEETVFETLDYLRSRNFEISLIQVLAPTELKLDLKVSSFVAVDAESGETVEIALDRTSIEEYARLLATRVSQLEAYCNRANITHTLISSIETLQGVVLKRFPDAGLLE